MTYADIRDKMTGWGPSRELLKFACALSDAQGLRDLADMLLFFEKPWNWHAEYAAWEAAGKPTDNSNDGWEAFTAAVAESA